MNNKYKRDLWLRFNEEVRDILAFGTVFSLLICLFSGIEIIPLVNYFLTGGVLVFLDIIKYK